MQALWAAGMVHRDIKPGNILIDHAGNAYITDFGLAKDSQGSVLTLPGQALGSMDYMAPEQIRGEAVHRATDLYALGAWCSNASAAARRSPIARACGVLWAHLQDEPPDPGSVVHRPHAGVRGGAKAALRSSRRAAPVERRVRPAAIAAAGIPSSDSRMSGSARAPAYAPSG